MTPVPPASPDLILAASFPGVELAVTLFRDTLLAWVFLAGLWLFGLVIALTLAIVALRARAVLLGRRRARLVAEWRPLLASAALGEDTPPRELARHEWADVAALWNHMHEVVRGEARARLEAYGRWAKLPAHARHALEHGPVRGRILAALTLGNLRVATAWAPLAELADGRNPALSYAAARALVRIDAERALPLLIRPLVDREDWAPDRVAGLLAEAGPALVDGPLAEAALDVARPGRLRALRFLAALRCPGLDGVVRRLLTTDDEGEVLAAALALAAAPDVLPAVRRLATHPAWLVRTQAAAALGRLGQPTDVETLRTMLLDEAWWVRFRAAQALGALPFVSLEAFMALAEEEPDASAREALAHVAAERAAAKP